MTKRRVWKRATELTGLGVALTGRYLVTRVQNAFSSPDRGARRWRDTHQKAGARIAETLCHLKGPIMKVGQLASAATGLLPDELARELVRLRRDVPPIPGSVIREQIQAELGAPPEQVFASFDAEPWAAASLGQVHRARLDDGREVAVKIQYPEVEEVIAADLAQLRLLFRAAGVLRRAKRSGQHLFADVEAQLCEEIDYEREAENVRLFSAFHCDRHPFLTLPEVIAEHSTRRILTLSFVDGDNLAAASEYPQETRDLIGEHLLEMLYSQMFGLGALHADPNPANYCFSRDARLTVVDFGCVKRLSDVEQAGLRDILSGVLEADDVAVERGLVALGARDPAAAPVEPELYRRCRELLAPALSRDRPFDVAAADMHRDLPALLPVLRRNARSFRWPVGMLLVQRLNIGVYGTLRQLRARVRFRAILERALEATDAPRLNAAHVAASRMRTSRSPNTNG